MERGGGEMERGGERWIEEGGEMERGGGRNVAFLVMAKTEAAGANKRMEGNR